MHSARVAFGGVVVVVGGVIMLSLEESLSFGGVVLVRLNDDVGLWKKAMELSLATGSLRTHVGLHSFFLVEMIGNRAILDSSFD